MTDQLDALLAERFGDPREDLRPAPRQPLPLDEPLMSPDEFALRKALERTEVERAARKRRKAK